MKKSLKAKNTPKILMVSLWGSWLSQGLRDHPDQPFLMIFRILKSSLPWKTTKKFHYWPDIIGLYFTQSIFVLP